MKDPILMTLSRAQAISSTDLQRFELSLKNFYISSFFFMIITFCINLIRGHAQIQPIEIKFVIKNA